MKNAFTVLITIFVGGCIPQQPPVVVVVVPCKECQEACSKESKPSDATDNPYVDPNVGNWKLESGL
jgi:hypothetical protein